MNDLQILDRVRNVIHEHLRIASPLDFETDVLRDLQLDSLKRLTLVVELENEFRICFDAADEDGLRTIGDLVRVISRRLEEAESGKVRGDA